MNPSTRRAVAFIGFVLAVFLVPGIIPGLGVSILSTFTVGIILLAWVSLKWRTLALLPTHSGYREMVVGGAIIIADFAENLARHSVIGLTDMLFIFVGIWVGLYGVRHAKLFVRPTLYIVALITGYFIEYNIPNVASLEYFIANMMTSMLQVIGVKATVFQNIVTLYSPSPVFLKVDGPCTGVQGILAFGLLASMTVLDVRTTPRKLVTVLVIGFTGAFLVNFVRLAMTFLSFQFLGTGTGAEMHAYVGYLLFLAWVLVFWNFAFKYLAKGMRPGPSGLRAKAL